MLVRAEKNRAIPPSWCRPVTLVLPHRIEGVTRPAVLSEERATEHERRESDVGYPHIMYFYNRAAEFAMFNMDQLADPTSLFSHSCFPRWIIGHSRAYAKYALYRVHLPSSLSTTALFSFWGSVTDLQAS